MATEEAKVYDREGVLIPIVVLLAVILFGLLLVAIKKAKK